MVGSIDLSAYGPGDVILKLPHPYLTEYTVNQTEDRQYQLCLKQGSSAQPLPCELHSSQLHFSAPADLKSSELPASADNSSWARTRRSPFSTVSWSGTSPTLAHAWLLLYVLFTVKPGMEMITLQLSGNGAKVLSQQLQDVLLGIQYPKAGKGSRAADVDEPETNSTAVVLRSTFWQGAGSPFGPRPVWCPVESPSSLPASNPLSAYPLTPMEYTLSVASAGDPQDPDRYQQSRHPIRPAKPAPGSIVYSRWIPHLRETFSMVSLDYTDAEHLRLFHEWQNDPRVSQGWNETGTLEQHCDYLRNIHEDPHQLAILAKWDDDYFAYFEVYWAKVCHPTYDTYPDVGDILLTDNDRRTDSVVIMTPRILIVAVIPSSATCASVALIV